MTSDELKMRCDRPLKVYIGFDPTADSLHLGNLLGLVALSWFQKFGHTPVALLGGATGRIGDPSGKSQERPLLSEAALSHNISCLGQFLKKILHFKEGPTPVILNNESWLNSFSFIDFLRDVGKHFRIGQMLGKESVRARMQSEDGLSFTEFSYQVLQAYDFYYLHQKQDIVLQLGGSDQWGNITAGVELNRRLGGDPIYGLTFPLLTRSDGKKFGKSEEGAIWLSPEKLSPYQFYQHLFRMSDADVIRMLKMLTFIDLQEIEEIEREMGRSSYVPNTAQKRLAAEVTYFVHGQEGLLAAERVSDGVAPGSESTLNAEALSRLVHDMPHALLEADQVVGKKFVDIALLVGLTPSKSEAVRLIQNGGAYLNNERISDTAFLFRSEDLIEGEFLLLSAGKKKRVLVQIKKILI